MPKQREKQSKCANCTGPQVASYKGCPAYKIQAFGQHVVVSQNVIRLETNHTESWRTIKNFLKPKGRRDYRALRLDVKTAKTNADKAQIFAESVERHFGTQSDNFDSNHFDEVNQFIEDNYEFFILLMITDRTWMMMPMITDLTWMPGGGGGALHN